MRATRRGLLGAGAVLAFPNLFLNRTLAATGQNPANLIRVGLIGVGPQQGMGNLNGFRRNVVAVCDVDAAHLAAARRAIEKPADASRGKPCAAYSDYRRLLEDKSIDAVCICTPDHWHTLIAADACLAGKDVYCEKPLTLTVREGQVLCKIVERTKRILQTGSQQRSESKFRRGCELVRSGYLGRITSVEVGLPGVNWTEEPPVPDGKPPKELDYNFWLGPAPQRPYNKHRVHYYFRFFWDYSGGQMTNWGAHHLDIAQWGLGMDAGGPVEFSGDASYQARKLYEVPEKFSFTCRYANGVTLICVSPGKENGTTFIGEKGRLRVSRGVLESDPEELAQVRLKSGDVHLYESSNHRQNWLDCIKSRKQPICDVTIGHRSASVCHLANIALRLGRKIKWDPAKEEIIGDAEASTWLARPFRAPWKLPEV